MYSDPQSVTVTGAGAISLPGTGQSPTSGEFTSGDGTVKLQISQAVAKRNRSSVRINLNKLATDPYVSTINTRFSAAINLSVDRPLVGFTNAEVKLLVTGLTTWLTASSGANIDKLLGGEH